MSRFSKFIVSLSLIVGIAGLSLSGFLYWKMYGYTEQDRKWTAAESRAIYTFKFSPEIDVKPAWIRDADGLYNPITKSIKIEGSNLSDEAFFSTYAHEYSHYMMYKYKKDLPKLMGSAKSSRQMEENTDIVAYYLCLLKGYEYRPSYIKLDKIQQRAADEGLIDDINFILDKEGLLTKHDIHRKGN